MGVRKVIYVAGPILRGDLAENIKQAHHAGVVLMMAGLSPIVPHGTCFWGNLVIDSPPAFLPERTLAGTTAEDWYAMDEAIVRKCDALLRLPGEGVGSDREVALAKSLGIPVFYSVDDIIAWNKGG